jgi:excinuclease UvrABC nuclease subunit
VFGVADNGETAVVTVASIRGSKMIGVSNYSVIDASDNLADVMGNFITQYYISNKLVPKTIVTEYSNEDLESWLNNFAEHKVQLRTIR